MSYESSWYTTIWVVVVVATTIMDIITIHHVGNGSYWFISYGKKHIHSKLGYMYPKLIGFPVSPWKNDNCWMIQGVCNSTPYLALVNVIHDDHSIAHHPLDHPIKKKPLTRTWGKRSLAFGISKWLNDTENTSIWLNIVITKVMKITFPLIFF